jgi:hypothetical protein
MVEAAYEDENKSTPQTLRRQEYWTMLSGATGQLYGNHSTWQFIAGWQGALDTPAVTQLQYLTALLAPRAWYALVPDQAHTVVTAGYGTFATSGSVSRNDYATAARTSDGTLVLAYMPTLRTLTVQLSQLSAPVTARWYDPTTGAYSLIASGILNVGAQAFTPPGPNGAGDGDWVLVLEAGAQASSPTLASLAPSSGPTIGGTTVTLTGTNFGTGATVSFGGTLATGVTVMSPTSLTAVTPAHAAGSVSVLVTNPDGQSGALANGYTYKGSRK